MAVYVLRLLEDRLDAGAEISPALVPLKRVLYVVEGSMTVAGEEREWESNSARFGIGPCGVKGGVAGARLWRWELVESPVGDEGLAAGAGVRCSAKMHNEIELDPQGDYLMRCDRVDFPLGGVAYTHTHAGPGTRCLLEGEIKVLVKGEESRLEPGGPWFESGPDPVYAQASKKQLTSFIRAMILPRSLQGKSSIRYVKSADEDKPKTQKYTRFVDEFIEL
jgi:hypothetical protein